MRRTIKLCMAAMLAAASLVASARPPEGFWFPDLELTKEKLALTDPATIATICNRMSGDGFYVLSLLIILKIDGNTLHVRGVGGGPFQSATLQNEDAKTGEMLYRSSPASTEMLELEVAPLSHGALKVRVAGRDTPELNALYWVPKSKQEVDRMDADLLAGKASLFENMVKACK